ncbi:MAG: hypothetical protein KBA15_11650 [Spirochaetes bacterium]|jgi:hypothetical protein|nr:hypothetical protein [Spirochaetota bacterium]
MKRSVLFSLILSMVLLPVFAQEKAAEKPADTGKVVTGDQLYSEITVEDFETTVYTDKDMSFTKSGEQQAGLSIRDQFPAPISNSKKYLGAKIYGKQGDSLTITPPKPLAIEKYCKTISIWVYGKNFSGELSMFIKDADSKVHRIPVGKLNFLGWRKLTVTLTDDVAQEDKFLTQKRQLEIMKFMYKPGNVGRLPLWNYFYMDDITAMVREKYTDRQSDEW